MLEQEKSDELWRRMKRTSEQSAGERCDDAELASLTQLAERAREALALEPSTVGDREFARGKLSAAIAKVTSDECRVPRERRAPAPARRSARMRWLVSAALFLIASIAAYRQFSSPPLDARELVKDHIEYLGNVAPAQFASSDARQVADWLGSQVGFSVMPVDLRSHGATLLGGRKCRIQQHLIAFMLYQRGEERLSLYEMNPATTRLAGLGAVRTDSGRQVWLGSDLGFNIAAWQDEGRLFVVVGSSPMNRLLKTVPGLRG